MQCEIPLFLTIVWLLTKYHANAASPVFSGLPTSVSVGELEVIDRLIYTLTVADADGDPYNCDVSLTVPTNAPFRVQKATDTDLFGVYTFNPSPGNTMFDYATTTLYTVEVRCIDSNSNARSANLSIDVQDNNLLEFTNLAATVSQNAATTGDNTEIFDVSYSDALGLTVTFAMTSLPATTSFTIDASTGKIKTARELRFETYTTIVLYVTVKDGKISVTDKLTVQLTNVNNVPYYTNLPASISINEDTAAGTLLYTLTAYDGDAGATLTYAMNVDPAADSGKFTFNTNTLQLSLTNGQTFDYETRTYYNVTFTVYDTMATGGPFVLDVNINNINEPCYFDRSYYYASFSEATAGSVTYNPGFVISDYDGASTYTLSFRTGNNSQRFSIDSSSGIVTFAVNYDIDGNAMPSNVILTVECSDPSSNTGTAILDITITDVNDNAPTFAQSSYTLTVDQYTSAGTLIGTITPTDADFGTNADFACSGSTSSGTAGTYYSIGSDCGVYLLSSPSGQLSYGTISRFTITAVDNGSPAMTGTTYVDIIYRETTTTTVTTTTTTQAYNFWDDAGAVAAFAIAMILACVVLAVLLYMLIRCCYTGACCGPESFDFCNCCKRRPGLGHREYKDFPQSSSPRLTPTDIEVGYRPVTRLIPTRGPLAVTYY
ncbi:hypothetical protein FSP39_004813 [Pinctada imbricata]|uniref:Cadherin domain-containing protein n=1 Tax=Pinctada imbricata TaxID=66713 RepID=A0AA88XL72_PINIB|nr:hypothetical protein FSP39_004813 [Pinctada imbricata]